MLQYISSPKEHDLAYETLWPFVFRAIVGRFPWEKVMKTAMDPTARLDLSKAEEALNRRIDKLEERIVALEKYNEEHPPTKKVARLTEEKPNVGPKYKDMIR